MWLIRILKPLYSEKNIDDNGYVLVEFFEPVSFDNYGSDRKKKQWLCNYNALFSSPEEARAAHDPEWWSKPPYNFTTNPNQKEISE